MRAVADRGLEPIAAPLLTIRPLSPAMPQRVQAILLTSGQAAAHLASLSPGLRDRPVLAVGDATAMRARDAGFSEVSSADGDAGRLAALAARTLSAADGIVLLACGQGQGLELATSLRQTGFGVVRRCVYRAIGAARLDPAAIAALRDDRVEAILFFSGETAERFASLLPRALAGRLSDVRALAISDAAASRLRGFGWKSLEAAARPTAASLLSLLG